MRCSRWAGGLLVILMAALGAAAGGLDEARQGLEARLAGLTPPARPAAAREWRALTRARAALLAYGGGARPNDLRHLVDLAVAIEQSRSPDPAVRAIFATLRQHQDDLAAAARAIAVAGVAELGLERDRQRGANALAKADAAWLRASAAWSVSPGRGARAQAQVIAAYQQTALAAASWLAREDSSSDRRYVGPPPEPGPVTFRRGGESFTVAAYPGEVQVLFDPVPTATSARALLASLGGRVLAQIPGVGYYLVGVTPGQEESVITQAAARPEVYLAWPHLAGYYAAAEATIIDDCGGSHGEAVKQVLIDRGVGTVSCRADGFGSRPVPSWTIWEVEQEIKARRTGPILINISSSQGLSDGATWDAQPESVRRQLLVSYADDRRALLKAISQLPLAARQDLVITLCAGNHHVPLDAILAELSADPTLRDILRDHLLIVGSKGQGFSNYATLITDDFAWVSNPEAAAGTSYAAPYALAVISKIMAQRGVSATAALRIAKQAIAAHPDHELVEADVLPVPGQQVYTGVIHGQATDTVEGSVWAAEVSLGLVVTLRGTGILGDPYEADLDFSGTLTETLEHCDEPDGCDPGGTYPVAGSGAQTSLGRISVTAWLDGVGDGFTVRLVDGTLGDAGRTLTATVTIACLGFDAPVTQTVTLTLAP